MIRPVPSCRVAADDPGPSTLDLNDEPTRTLAIRMARHKARQLAARSEFSPADREELAQELLLHVIRRAPKFDSSKGSIQAFIATLIARRAASLLRREMAAKRDAHQCCSLNMLIRADDGTRVELASTITEDAPVRRRRLPRCAASWRPEAPDVCTAIEGVHFEVKRREAFRLWEAVTQAVEDAGDNVPVVLHRANGKPWIAVVRLDDLPKLAMQLYLTCAATA